jgi:hypothetical protein
MASKAKKTAKPKQTQAQRFLEAAKAAGVTDKSFQRAMGKLTLQRQARKKVG